MKRIIPILVLVVVLAVAGYFGWTYYSQQSSAGANTLGGSGTIETEQVAITPQTSGRIIAAPEEEGVPVKKGDVLYRLDPAIANLQVQQAIAGANAAAANLRNVRDDSASTKADVDAARAQSDQANIAVKMAKVQAGYATVTSPIDGVVSSIAAKTGENAVPGSTLAVISNPASLTVTVFVPESLIGQVKVGQSGALTTDSVTKTYHGQVVFIATQAEFTPASIETKDQRVKLVYQVKLRIIDADAALKPGMPADVVLQ
jgi:HlyD family secretion protein